MGKGREITAAVVLFLLPSLCLAQGTISLSGDRTHIIQGESFTLTLDLSVPEGVGLQFGQFQLSVDGGMSDAYFTGQFDAEGDWFGVSGGFGANSLAANTQMNSPVSLAGLNPELIFHAGAETSLTSGSLATYTITADAAAPLGIYWLSLNPVQTIFTNAAGVVPMEINPFRFEVPEPSSALLLLAGVPLLMRRRHA